MTDLQRELMSVTRPVWFRLAFTVAAILLTGIVLLLLHSQLSQKTIREVRNVAVADG